MTPESSSYLTILSLHFLFLLSPLSPNIVVDRFCQHGPGECKKGKFILMLLPKELATYLQHSNKIEYCENTYVILADIPPHMEIYVSPMSLRNCV